MVPYEASANEVWVLVGLAVAIAISLAGLLWASNRRCKARIEQAKQAASLEMQALVSRWNALALVKRAAVQGTEPAPVVGRRTLKELLLTRAQVTGIAALVIDAAFDRIESCVPPCTSQDGMAGIRVTGYAHGALETAGMALACLYAQLNGTGDGMAIGDAIDIVGLDKVMRQFADARCSDPNAPLPDGGKMAEAFVRQVFADTTFPETVKP